MYQMSRVTCQVSNVTCFFYYYFEQSGEASRVCNQRGYAIYFKQYSSSSICLVVINSKISNEFQKYIIVFVNFLKIYLSAMKMNILTRFF